MCARINLLSLVFCKKSETTFVQKDIIEGEWV